MVKMDVTNRLEVLWVRNSMQSNLLNFSLKVEVWTWSWTELKRLFKCSYCRLNRPCCSRKSRIFGFSVPLFRSSQPVPNTLILSHLLIWQSCHHRSWSRCMPPNQTYPTYLCCRNFHKGKGGDDWENAEPILDKRGNFLQINLRKASDAKYNK